MGGGARRVVPAEALLAGLQLSFALAQQAFARAPSSNCRIRGGGDLISKRSPFRLSEFRPGRCSRNIIANQHGQFVWKIGRGQYQAQPDCCAGIDSQASAIIVGDRHEPAMTIQLLDRSAIHRSVVDLQLDGRGPGKSPGLYKRGGNYCVSRELRLLALDLDREFDRFDGQMLSQFILTVRRQAFREAGLSSCSPGKSGEQRCTKTFAASSPISSKDYANRLSLLQTQRSVNKDL